MFSSFGHELTIYNKCCFKIWMRYKSAMPAADKIELNNDFSEKLWISHLCVSVFWGVRLGGRASYSRPSKANKKSIMINLFSLNMVLNGMTRWISIYWTIEGPQSYKKPSLIRNSTFKLRAPAVKRHWKSSAPKLHSNGLTTIIGWN